MADQTAGASSRWVVFTCDGRHFALPLGRVRAILHSRPLTRIPGCGPTVCGLLGLRGRVVTVLDFGAALGLRPSATILDHRLLLVEAGERTVAGAVEVVAAVTRVDGGDGWRIITGAEPASGEVHGEGERVAIAVDPDELLGGLLA
jgi:purine-binding chemotaxis protein CheW